jgi:hypothetical protein
MDFIVPLLILFGMAIAGWTLFLAHRTGEATMARLRIADV